MSARIIGIDLGTTNSEVAALTDKGVVVLEEGGTGLLPSVVGVAPDGRLLVGEEARNQLVLHPDRTVRSVKRLMGTEEKVVMAGERYRPQEISALILSALRDRAERILGEKVEAAVITVPAYFSDAQRQSTREAGEIAGLRVERILNEPTAASLAYEQEGGEGGEGRTVLVYDLGGGTFDVSIVRIEPGVNEVLASHGDTHLGGEDLDEALLEHVVGRLEDKSLRRAIRMEPRVRSRMMRAVEELRVKLSSAPYARIREDSVKVVSEVPLHVDLEVTRDELEECVRPLLERTLKSVHRALEEAEVESRDLDAVVLAGGVTRTPLVQELLREATGLDPRGELHPDLCVALGAGLQAARQEGSSESRVLVDVTPHSFGPSHIGLRDGEWDPHCYTPVITRGSPLPVSVTAPYYTHWDEQEVAQIVVYQGESPYALENTEIGRFCVEGLSKVPAGNEILCRLELDLNGILKVTATEKRTGLARSVRIEGAVGRLGERELVQAKQRVADLTGREVGEPAATGEAGPGGEAASLLTRYEALRERIHEEDRSEGDVLVEKIRSAGDDAGEATEELRELLFYLEGSAS